MIGSEFKSRNGKRLYVHGKNGLCDENTEKLEKSETGLTSQTTMS